MVFPPGEDPTHYHLKVIECSWLPEARVWEFMRERRDKDTPNAYHVYESVARSIQDNIQEPQLLEYIKEVGLGVGQHSSAAAAGVGCVGGVDSVHELLQLLDWVHSGSGCVRAGMAGVCHPGQNIRQLAWVHAAGGCVLVGVGWGLSRTGGGFLWLPSTA